MKRLAFAIPMLLCLASAASAQESAKVQLTLKISPKTASFKDQRLVVMLYHNHPLQDDRGLSAVDRFVDAKFSHQTGKETKLTVTVGEKAKFKSGVHYTLSVTVFDKANKVTHVGEIDGEGGPFTVLTTGSSNKLAIVLRPGP